MTRAVRENSSVHLPVNKWFWWGREGFGWEILDLAKQKDNMIDKLYQSARPWTHGQEPGRVHGWRQIHTDQSKENNVECQGKP